MKKKKILILFLTIIILFTGCNTNNEEQQNETNNNTESKGRLYSIVNLQDKGINMFTSILPEGWNYKISSQDMVSSSYPFVETVVLTNPNNTAKITFFVKR